MIQVIARATRQTLWPLLAFGALATPAFAQAPSDAQRAAIKSNCRSDYMAHCSSIAPGGAASLQCLQQNMASLSSACASAVKAVSGASETKTEPTAKEEPKQETKSEPAPAAEPAKTADEPAKTAAEPAAKSSTKSASGKPSSAQISAIRANCRSDYPKVCAGVPTGGAPALQCLEKNKAKLSAACEKAVAAATSGGGAAPAASGSGAPATANASPDAAPAAAPPPALMLRPMRPREILFVMRSACGADVQSLCAGVPPGGGRIIECLASQSASLSPACRDVLGQFAQ
jgi:hypothetical protein